MLFILGGVLIDDVPILTCDCVRSYNEWSSHFCTITKSILSLLKCVHGNIFLHLKLDHASSEPYSLLFFIYFFFITSLFLFF